MSQSVGSPSLMMAAANNTETKEIDSSTLTYTDYQIIQGQIDEQARRMATSPLDYQQLLMNEDHRKGVMKRYIEGKQKMQREFGFLNQGSNCNKEAIFGERKSEIGSSADPVQMFYNASLQGQTDLQTRETIIEDFEVVMSQFKSKFKDTSNDSLRTDGTEQRLAKYPTKIGMLGSKMFDLDAIPTTQVFRAMFLYILDDIEAKQRASRNYAGIHFLERIGMDTDLSSYYRAHRKSNLGGTSGAIQNFNEQECFSFRRACSKAGLKSDVAAMIDASTRNAKTHPYERKSYGPPRSKRRDAKNSSGTDT